MSDLETNLITIFRVKFSSIKSTKNLNTDVIAEHIYNKYPYKIALPLGLLKHCETNAILYPTQEKTYRVNDIVKLLFSFLYSAILNEKLLLMNRNNYHKLIKLLMNRKKNRDYFKKLFFETHI